ncbi:MAG TPA: hypothetical protein VF586_15145, partial [Pyrinomonadaceae bacterium]
MTRPRHGLRVLSASLLLAALLGVSATLPASTAGQGAGEGGAGFVNLALPAGGEVSVENWRGGVWVEVWDGEQVGLAASVGPGAEAPKAAKPSARRAGRSKQSAAGSRLPVSVEHGSSLKITVERAAVAGAPRVDLRLRVPPTARLKVYTSDGEVEVNGLPASLVAQTLSGELRLALPAASGASVIAQSLNGSVHVGRGVESDGSEARETRGKFQMGSGSPSVNLFSGRGRISLDTSARVAADSGSAR